MLYRILVLAIALLLPWSLADILAQDYHEDHLAEYDIHEGHDHDAHAIENEHKGHDHSSDTDDHADPQDHGDHEDELIVELTAEAAALAGLKMSTVNHGRIGSTVELPGEVGFNEDRLAHISPRFAGIALDVKYRVGDYVEAGSAMAVVESNESMTSYTIKAPISGWVIDRHITPGEYVSDESSIFVIADLSTVWVNLAVYTKDYDRVQPGQMALIKAVGTTTETRGTIDYVTPIVNLRTRSATARIVLPNKNNSWRPGSFVQATVVSPGDAEGLLVEKNAVQYLDGETIVFVADAPNRFRPVQVTTGLSDDRFIHILGGLQNGTQYVSSGAFELKAKIVTSNLDPHAGHGH
jgi:cobalt-zinc-cadmium efflux system membrane fusion protein